MGCAGGKRSAAGAKATSAAAKLGGRLAKAGERGQELERLLDRWWPDDLPFPPVVPWLAGFVSRQKLRRSVRELGWLLPAPPEGGEAAEIEYVVDLASKVVTAGTIDYGVFFASMCGGETDKEAGNSGEYGTFQEHACEGASPGTTCVEIGVGDFPEKGPCEGYDTACVVQHSDCTYDIFACGCDIEADNCT